MDKKLLLDDGEYSIWRHKGIPDAAMQFLDSISWGNEGAVYEHLNVDQHIKFLHQPTLIAIHERDWIQGTAVFCNTQIMAGDAKYNCYYVRYFAASKEIKGKGVMKHYSQIVMEKVRDEETEKSIYFACIERGNKGSYRVVESAGYNKIGTIKSNGFSRFFPKSSSNIEQIKTDEQRAEVLGLLREQYKDHSLVQFNSIFHHDAYYVIRENGVIVAGCQKQKAHWVMNSMPGFMGKIIMKVIPRLPLFNKLFNPKKFKFLAFEGIYFKPGYEHRLHELFEGLLASEKLNSAMYWMGETCPWRIKLMNYGKTGTMHAFIKESDVYILAAFQNMNEKEVEDVRSRALYASAFDYI